MQVGRHRPAAYQRSSESRSRRIGWSGTRTDRPDRAAGCTASSPPLHTGLRVEQRQRPGRRPAPRRHQHRHARDRADHGPAVVARGTRAGRTAGAGPAAGHRRRSPRPAPRPARRGSGRSRPVTRPGSPGTPRPCRGHRPDPGAGRPPCPGPPPAACSPIGCPPAGAPVRRGNTTGPRNRAAPSRRPGSARTRGGRQPGAGLTVNAPAGL